MPTYLELLWTSRRGWGLFLVESVSDRWGIDETHPHSAWFEVDR